VARFQLYPWYSCKPPGQRVRNMQETPRKGSDTREHILDVAEAAVLEKGFAATSIEELIAAVGITKSGFFYHFKDKNELAKALTIDSSVFERWRYDPKYHPANLAAWARRYDIDVASLVGSFSTDSRLTISD
jgi:AcrR family transcriptional regulator